MGFLLKMVWVIMNHDDGVLWENYGFLKKNLCERAWWTEKVLVITHYGIWQL
jgi:hypothetical protein